MRVALVTARRAAPGFSVRSISVGSGVFLRHRGGCEPVWSVGRWAQPPVFLRFAACPDCICFRRSRGFYSPGLSGGMDVLCDLPLWRASRRPGSLPRQTSHDRLEEGLGGRIIKAVPGSAHRRSDAILSQDFLMVVRAVLAAAVCMMDTSRGGRGSAMAKSDARNARYRFMRLPTALSITRRECRSSMTARSSQPDIPDVASPFLVWKISRDVPVRQVRGDVEALVAVRGCLELLVPPDLDAVLRHQTADTPMAHDQSQLFQLAGHARATQSAKRLLERSPDMGKDNQILVLACAHGTGPSGAITTRTAIHDLVQAVHGDVAPVFPHEGTPHLRFCARSTVAGFLHIPLLPEQAGVFPQPRALTPEIGLGGWFLRIASILLYPAARRRETDPEIRRHPLARQAARQRNKHGSGALFLCRSRRDLCSSSRHDTRPEERRSPATGPVSWTQCSGSVSVCASGIVRVSSPKSSSSLTTRRTSLVRQSSHRHDERPPFRPICPGRGQPSNLGGPFCTRRTSELADFPHVQGSLGQRDRIVQARPEMAVAGSWARSVCAATQTA